MQKKKIQDYVYHYLTVPETKCISLHCLSPYTRDPDSDLLEIVYHLIVHHLMHAINLHCIR